jgi:hypothetical protein
MLSVRGQGVVYVAALPLLLAPEAADTAARAVQQQQRLWQMGWQGEPKLQVWQAAIGAA